MSMSVEEKRAMAESWPNFDIFADELHCQCDHCLELTEDELIEQMPDELFYFVDDTIQPMRTQAGFPFPVTSAHRCPLHPDEVVKQTIGPHRLCAIDLGLTHKRADKVLKLSYDYPQITGRGINQKGAVAGRFVHFDPLGPTSERARPHIWTY